MRAPKPLPTAVKSKKTVTPLAVSILTIRLTAFYYDLDYEVKNKEEVGYTIEILNRLNSQEKIVEMDMLVNITYLEKDREEPILTASCLTTYALEGLATKPDTEDDSISVIIPDELMLRMHEEASSHARALIAIQTAATPFSKTHIAFRTQFVRSPESIKEQSE